MATCSQDLRVKGQRRIPQFCFVFIFAIKPDHLSAGTRKKPTHLELNKLEFFFASNTKGHVKDLKKLAFHNRSPNPTLSLVNHCYEVGIVALFPLELLALTFTLVAGVALPVASGTFALVGSHSVDAVASSTETWHCLALVHIWERDGEHTKTVESTDQRFKQHTHTKDSECVYSGKKSNALTIIFVIFFPRLFCEMNCVKEEKCCLAPVVIPQFQKDPLQLSLEQEMAF